MSFSSKFCDKSEFEKGNAIGSGSFGSVYLAKEIATENQFALKEISPNQKGKGKNNIKYQKEFFQEAENLSRCKYPSILSLYKISFDPPFWLITEYCPNGSILDFINDSDRKADITKKIIIIYGVAFGLNYLHSINVIHRDIKPGNILLDSNFYPKICDFGLAKLNTSSTVQNSTLAGTTNYCAPEVLLSKSGTKYDGKKADVFSFGMTIYSVFFDETPYKEFENEFLIYQQITQNKRPIIEEESIPKTFKNLIEQCWNHEPGDRPDFSTVVSTIMDPNTINEIKQFYSNFDEEKLREYLKLFSKFTSKTKIDLKSRSDLNVLEKTALEINFEIKTINQERNNFLNEVIIKLERETNEEIKDIQNNVMEELEKECSRLKNENKRQKKKNHKDRKLFDDKRKESEKRNEIIKDIMERVQKLNIDGSFSISQKKLKEFNTQYENDTEKKYCFKDDPKFTKLHFAAKTDDIQMGEFLISQGADINAKAGGYEPTPLHIAVYKDSYKMAELLIMKGANINSRTKGGQSPLHWAAINKRIKMVELLISHGAEVDARDGEGWTPLHHATYNDSIIMGELFLSNGADINAKNWNGITPLHCAKQYGKKEMLKFLRSKGAKN